MTTRRLPFLDGIRGLAALYVLLHHTWQFALEGVTAPPPAWFKLLLPLKFGHFAVALFIVLSGFCLTLPTLAAPDLALPGGLAGFVRRRARRILPPYYGALALSAALTWLFPALRTPTGGAWDRALPLTAPGLAAHAALVHNLFPATQWTFDPPLWSVALEWQIYGLFALALLPIARRAGVPAAVGVALAAGLAPTLWGKAYLCSWYLGLFGLGMAAAWVYGGAAPERLRRAPWTPLALVLAAAFAALVFRQPWVVLDTLVGASFSAYLIGAATRSAAGAPGPLERLLEGRPVAATGGFSYSLYLIHYPLLATAALWGGADPGRRMALLTLAAAGSVVVAAGFARALERR